MKISRELAIQILKYLNKHKRFYFPFMVMCKGYATEDEDFVEVEPCEWKIIKEDKSYRIFELWENLQNLYKNTVELMAKGFIEKITHDLLEKHIEQLAENYRKEWKEGLWESEKIEEFRLNEFIGGKAEAYEDCLYLIKRYQYKM